MISLIKNSSYGGTIAILVASVLWGTTGTAAAFAPTLGPLAIGAVAMGGGGLLQALVASRAIRENRQFIRENLSILPFRHGADLHYIFAVNGLAGSLSFFAGPKKASH